MAFIQSIFFEPPAVAGEMGAAAVFGDCCVGALVPASKSIAASDPFIQNAFLEAGCFGEALLGVALLGVLLLEQVSTALWSAERLPGSRGDLHSGELIIASPPGCPLASSASSPPGDDMLLPQLPPALGTICPPIGGGVAAAKPRTQRRGCDDRGCDGSRSHRLGSMFACLTSAMLP